MSTTTAGPPAPTRTWLVTVATVPAVALGLVVTVVLALLLSWVGLVVGLAITAGLAAWVASRAAADPSPALLSRLGARPADAEREARLVNLVEGLAVSGGIAAPALHVVDDEGANLVAFGIDDRHAHLVVTTGLLDRLERIELEGVLARAVTQIRHGELPAATTAVELLEGGGGVGLLSRPVAGVVASRLRRVISVDDDVLLDRDAVGLTRYPPGLCSALRKLAGATEVHRPVGSTGALWFADPDGERAGSERPSLVERADALELL